MSFQWNLFSFPFFLCGISPFVPLFIRRDPALRRLERQPKIYDRIVPSSSRLRLFNVSTREALDYMVENKDALWQLAMLGYSAMLYIFPNKVTQ